MAQTIAGRRSEIDGAMWHAGYAGSQCIRKRIEEAFGPISVHPLGRTPIGGVKVGQSRTPIDTYVPGNSR